MGRGTKKVVEHNIDRRELGYYSTPRFVGDYIASRMLDIYPMGEKVLDPCCGKGELFPKFLEAGKSITGIDILRHGENPRIEFINGDFIDLYKAWKNAGKLPLDYDYIIANPPYNCHEVNYIRDNKSELEKLFCDVGTHNMYSMFISAIIDCARPGAVIGLITSDSYFTAKYHEKLREKILDQCSIHEIIMCPTDLFLDQGADVRTSIVILQKGKRYQGKVRVRDRCSSTAQLKEVLENGQTMLYDLKDIILENKKDNMEFIIECPDDIKALFRKPRLGEVFDCVTGISTGSDGLYLSGTRYGPFTVPFYKNPGRDRFFTNKFLYLHRDFLKFDSEIKNFMVRNKKLLYRQGITCSSMGVTFTACYLPPDSTYGVNANIICDEKDTWWLLAYLNSKLVQYMVRGVMIRSNMVTSGYVSRIPLIKLGRAVKDQLGEMAREAYELARNGRDYSGLLGLIDAAVFESAKISPSTVDRILRFNRELIKNA